eukprot:TRINITY_DN2096_c0_g1_i1.p1 TRINITY_DN2096_c0_g1~~TRINITY_DN2096_c0_g1_i1.p1  ORF type:complete len:373 (+),score=141.81 TRINITY_DN2096_c0_g1_i1:38-1120(+)
MTLSGHTSEVFVVAWNPRSSVLASGSGDSTARLWAVPAAAAAAGGAAAVAAASPLILKHYDTCDTRDDARVNDVTTLDWNARGSMLATGSYDGCARIWSEAGVLQRVLKAHRGPLFSLKWNKPGNYLLSGSVDRTTVVWDATSGVAVKQFCFHASPTVDVDWRDDVSFASCSTDKMIYVCALGADTPVRTFEGHKDEINAIKWDPSGTLLASCSDDFTAKVWSVESPDPLLNLWEHSKEIYTCRWSPAVRAKLLLATASFDSTVKLWDVTGGRCETTLAGHADPVYSVAWSPNGEYLASGSFDRAVIVWDVKTGKKVRTFRGHGGVFEVAWNTRGDRLAACFSNNAVVVMDTRMWAPLTF